MDGNGILHHRGFGVASHFGVLYDVPTIGVAKSILVVDQLAKKYTRQSTNEQHRLLIGASGTTWGAAVWPTDTVLKPIFVSVGHRISLETAIDIVLRCCHYRVPEPIRQADLRSREIIREWKHCQDPSQFQMLTRVGTRTNSRALQK